MKNAPWVIAAVAIGLCVFVLMCERDEFVNREEAWQVERDSMIAGWNATVADLAALRAHTDSLRAYTDSVVMTYPPAPIVIRRALKTFEHAPLQMAVDTLGAE